MFRAVSKGVVIPPRLLGALRESDDVLFSADESRRRLAQDGYLLFCRALPVHDVVEARKAIFQRLAEVDEIDDPPIDGIATGRSRRPVQNLGRFWKSVSEEPALRKVTHGAAVRAILAAIFGGPAIGHDLIYLRAAAPGRAIDLHFDYPFFTRATRDVLTVWIPLGDVPVTEGPLFIVEGSNKFDDLFDQIRNMDPFREPNQKVAYDQDLASFAAARNTRILTRDFKMGDVVIFNMFTAHGSLDNCSTIGRTRLSCDLRYQPESAPRDEVFFGDSPSGVTGNGYADLNGAKPLTAIWPTF
jgi:Phytanoyl-CoA dioxygenase (PhyH)